MSFKLSKRSEERLEGVDERIIDIVDLALKITRVDFGIPEYGGTRTEEEQALLFSKGLSKCDGFKYKSMHQTGLAFDVYAYVGFASWDEKHLAQVAAAILQAASVLGYKLEWGGHWKSFVDMPHFQLID